MKSHQNTSCEAVFSEKLHFQIVFCPHENEKAGIFKFSRFEERFAYKLRFRNGLVLTVGLTGEITLRFQELSDDENCISFGITTTFVSPWQYIWVW